MSYILDALRKSETERRQGKIPDLGQQVQLIHHSRKKRMSPAAWIAIALVLNAVVLAVVFWPLAPEIQPDVQAGVVIADEAIKSEPMPKPEPIQDSAPQVEPGPVTVVTPRVISEEPVWERPTIIVPSSPAVRDSQPLAEPRPAGRVPHLVELPLSFQKSIPDLTFNSHIYASEPSARRVMINNNYLRRGDAFSGLKVEDITDDGVVLSKHGVRFRVGVVRDWVSPN
jgi:general secretion pathway protein B